jgi:hypothetical protein
MKLSQAIDVYVRRRQGAGWRFDAQARQLRSFLRQHGDAELRRITATRVAAFLNGLGVKPSTWNQKRGTFKVFFEYWAVCGQVKTSPVPNLIRIKSSCVVLKIAESRHSLAKPLRVGDGAVKLVTGFVEFELASLRSL